MTRYANFESKIVEISSKFRIFDHYSLKITSNSHIARNFLAFFSAMIENFNCTLKMQENHYKIARSAKIFGIYVETVGKFQLQTCSKCRKIIDHAKCEIFWNFVLKLSQILTAKWGHVRKNIRQSLL